jgi:hypothetical protein
MLATGAVALGLAPAAAAEDAVTDIGWTGSDLWVVYRPLVSV